jgi:hypothetical protein
MRWPARKKYTPPEINGVVLLVCQQTTTVETRIMSDIKVPGGFSNPFEAVK